MHRCFIHSSMYPRSREWSGLLQFVVMLQFCTQQFCILYSPANFHVSLSKMSAVITNLHTIANSAPGMYKVTRGDLYDLALTILKKKPLEDYSASELAGWLDSLHVDTNNTDAYVAVWVCTSTNYPELDKYLGKAFTCLCQDHDADDYDLVIRMLMELGCHDAVGRYLYMAFVEEYDPDGALKVQLVPRNVSKKKKASKSNGGSAKKVRVQVVASDSSSDSESSD